MELDLQKVGREVAFRVRGTVSVVAAVLFPKRRRKGQTGVYVVIAIECTPSRVRRRGVGSARVQRRRTVIMHSWSDAALCVFAGPAAGLARAGKFEVLEGSGFEQDVIHRASHPSERMTSNVPATLCG